MAVAGERKGATMIFEAMGRALGVALANLVNIFNFPLYLLSGGHAAGLGSLRARHDRGGPQALLHFPHTRHAHREGRCWATRPGLYGAAYLPLQANSSNS